MTKRIYEATWKTWILFSIWVPLASAQVTPPTETRISTDGTFGAPTLITDGLDGAVDGTFTIQESFGSRPGGGANLFQRLSEFDIRSGDTAEFGSSAGIDRIIAEYTGENAARIFGRIRSDDTNADLYLLGRSGFVFGSNARLDVNGSVTFAAADYLRMLPGDEDGSMTFSGDASLASANPIAFGFLGTPVGEIQLDGSFLEGADGQRLSLFGGDLRAVNADLRVDDGALELLSVGERGEILIQADGTSRVEEGVAGGTIDFEGTDALVRFNFAGSSFDTAVRVEAEELVLDGSDLGALVDSAAPGGDIEVSARRLEMRDASQIRAEAGPFTSGAGGDIRIDGDTIALFDRSEISTASQGGGVAGSIEIEAGEIELRSGGAIESIGLDSGDGGTIMVTADRVSLIGGLVDDARSQPSSISSTAGVNGANAGDINLEVDRLELIDGGRISADTLGSGDGGAVRINANTVEVTGQNEALLAVLPFSAFDFDDPSGSEVLNVLRDVDYARSGIAATTLDTGFNTGFASGRAGDIVINAGRLTVDQGGLISANSTTQAEAGSVTIDANRVDLGEGALIDSSSENDQASGVRISAQTIQIEGGAINASSGDGAANGGSIEVDASGLLRIENGLITSDFSGPAGSGGDISIEGDALILEETTITANALVANGGSVTVSSPTFLDLGGNTITATGGTGGTQGVVSITSPEVNLVAGATPLAINYMDASSMLRPACAARTVAGGDSSFVVQARRAYPSSPEGILVAFDAATGDGALGKSGDQIVSQAGSAAFQEGDYAAASKAWTEASARWEVEGKPKEQLLALRGAGQSQFAEGRYAEAVEPITRAIEIAESQGDIEATAAGLGDLGNTYLALGELEEAESALMRGLGMLKKESDQAFATRLLNSLGNLHAARFAHVKALESYMRAAEIAKANGRSLDAARAYANAARSALNAEQRERSALLLAHARRETGSLEASIGKLYLQIHLAATYRSLAEAASGLNRESLLAAHQLLSDAVQQSERYADERARSFALGNLGALYESDDRIDEALYLTRQALAASEAAAAAEAIYRWHWQEGRLLWGQGRAEPAIAAYQRALAVLEESRQSSADRYDAAQWSFERSIGPVYQELTDRLLQASSRVQDTARQQTLLREARQTMERLRAAELRNYFEDECIADLAGSNRSGPAVPKHVAIVYPILLENRLDLLIQTKSGMAYHSVAGVGRAAVETAAEAFRTALTERRGNGYRAYSKRLYDWLLRPYAEGLERKGVSTLVFVTDGKLRTIPMGALNDGERFLVDRFAVTSAPALGLIDPAPFQSTPARTLIAGVSESVSGFPALAAVEAELASVEARLGGELLLNDSFQRARLQELFAQRSPSVLHIASHAVFRGDPDKSFILAHDGPLTMKGLADMVGQGRRSEPLELLVLSACETALGDDRAGLGLAGVAIRAGARSALGSLWSIADNAASDLIDDFYRGVSIKGMSKAEALRRAQVALRNDPRYAHPFYWSPYLLVSGWL